MKEPQDVFQNFGGRKFLLALIGLAALLIMASLNPAAATTEVIVGILGILATYSGSNSLLTAIMSKGQNSSSDPNQTQAALQPTPIETEDSQNKTIEQRVQALEDAMNSFIEILKVQNDTLNRLTISQNQSNLDKRGLDERQNIS